MLKIKKINKSNKPKIKIPRIPLTDRRFILQYTNESKMYEYIYIEDKNISVISFYSFSSCYYYKDKKTASIVFALSNSLRKYKRD